MTELEWKDPPSSKHLGSPRWRAIAEELRRHPGRWAVIVHATTSNIAPPIRNGVYVSFQPAGSFEAVVRNVGQDAEGRRLFDCYARYVGDH